MTAEDLSSFSAEWVEPISIDYRGWRVYELPPNGQGMCRSPQGNAQHHGSVVQQSPELHKRIEAMKLAYSDVYRYNADPRTNKVPVAKLLSKEHARERAALIDPRNANCHVTAAQINGSDTIYLTVADREGNIVSWIQSIYSNFGSGITVEGLGFALQNRGAGFTLDPAHPNVLAGGGAAISTPSSRVSWSAATCTLDSASWVDPISLSRMRSSYRTSSIME